MNSDKLALLNKFLCISFQAKVCPTKHELEGMRSIVEFLLDEGFSSQPSDLHHHDDIISDAMVGDKIL